MKEFKEYCILAALMVGIGVLSPLVALAQASAQPSADDSLFLVIAAHPDALTDTVNRNDGTVIGGLQSPWSMLVAGAPALRAELNRGGAWFVVPANALASLCSPTFKRT